MSEQKICPTCGTEYPLSERFCPRDGTALRGQNAQGDLMGSIVAERYHVLKKLGEGGMGQVYLAEHVKMGRKSALKVMNPGMNQDADAIARFNREAANASRLNHPNICAIYDFGETPEGLIYLAMEFVEGESLTALIERSGMLPAARAASIIHQAADALGIAHDAGIVHRDLKPDNIMIAKGRDGADLVKVVDFGIAKASTSDAQKVTKTGLVVGTPEYMSPEQLAGDKLDGRSDIYSLGLVAFNCLTGTLPFPSNSAQEAMIMRLTDHPRTLTEMRPEIAWPEALQQVMDRALARDAVDRYQHAPEFGRDMARAVEDMPQTVLATAGTQVMGAPAAALPATRVGSAGGATQKVGAAGTRGMAAAAPENVAPVAAKKSPAILIGAAVVVIAAVGGGMVMMKGKDAGAPTSENTAPPVPTTNPQPSPKNNVPAPSAPTESPTNRKTTTPATGNERTSPPPKPDYAQTLAQLEREVDSGDPSKATGEKVLGDVNAILGSLSGNDLGEAYYVQMLAYASMEDPRTCAAARKVKETSIPETKRKRADAFLSASCKSTTD